MVLLPDRDERRSFASASAHEVRAQRHEAARDHHSGNPLGKGLPAADHSAFGRADYSAGDEDPHIGVRRRAGELMAASRQVPGDPGAFALVLGAPVRFDVDAHDRPEGPRA